MSEEVVPSRESTPKRMYKRSKEVIEVHSVSSNGWTVDPKDYLYTIVLSSEEEARQLMDDLYYGEYTGG